MVESSRVCVWPCYKNACKTWSNQFQCTSSQSSCSRSRRCQSARAAAALRICLGARCHDLPHLQPNLCQYLVHLSEAVQCDEKCTCVGAAAERTTHCDGEAKGSFTPRAGDGLGGGLVRVDHRLLARMGDRLLLGHAGARESLRTLQQHQVLRVPTTTTASTTTTTP